MLGPTEPSWDWRRIPWRYAGFLSKLLLSWRRLLWLGLQKASMRGEVFLICSESPMDVGVRGTLAVRNSY